MKSDIWIQNVTRRRSGTIPEKLIFTCRFSDLSNQILNKKIMQIENRAIKLTKEDTNVNEFEAFRIEKDLT